jgi:hypothetical protein
MVGRGGRFAMDYPYYGDETFYDRLARNAGIRIVNRCRVVRVPWHARFGLPRTNDTTTA